MVKNLFIFAAGATIGSAVTWKIIKTKYEQIAQEEIDSVKEVFSRRLENKLDESEDPDDDDYDDDNDSDDFNYDFKPDKNEIKAMNDKVKNLGYTEYSKKKNKKSKCKEVRRDEDDELVPYVISPDDFGETGYDTVSLTYYSDNVLADDYDEVVEDAELLIGNYSLDSFGTYEEDIVHVRNDETQTDYEICRVNETYSDVASVDDTTEG